MARHAAICTSRASSVVSRDWTLIPLSVLAEQDRIRWSEGVELLTWFDHTSAPSADATIGSGARSRGSRPTLSQRNTAGSAVVMVSTMVASVVVVMLAVADRRGHEFKCLLERRTVGRPERVGD